MSGLQTAGALPIGDVVGQASGYESRGEVAESEDLAANFTGTDDPEYGAMIAAQPAGQQRSDMYGFLLLQDPEFRERERLRSMNKETE